MGICKQRANATTLKLTVTYWRAKAFGLVVYSRSFQAQHHLAGPQRSGHVIHKIPPRPPMSLNLHGIKRHTHVCRQMTMPQSIACIWSSRAAPRGVHPPPPPPLQQLPQQLRQQRRALDQPLGAPVPLGTPKGRPAALAVPAPAASPPLGEPLHRRRASLSCSSRSSRSIPPPPPPSPPPARPFSVCPWAQNDGSSSLLRWVNQAGIGIRSPHPRHGVPRWLSV